MRTDLLISLGLSLIAVFFVVSGAISVINIRNLNDNSQQIFRTSNRLLALNEVLSDIKDAETGQRGYVITGDTQYLEPYTSATSSIEEQLAVVSRLSAGNIEQQARLDRLKTRIDTALDYMRQTVETRKSQGFAAALAMVETNRGKDYMDDIRAQISAIQTDEMSVRAERQAEMKAAFQSALFITLVTAVIGILLAIAITYMVSRAAAQRRREQWLQNGQVGISAAMMGEQNLQSLGRVVLNYLADYCGAKAGAFYVLSDNMFERTATMGVPDDNDIPLSFRPDHTVLGKAVTDGGILQLEDLEDSHLSVGAGLGQWRPRSLLVLPTQVGGHVNAVVELGFLHGIDRDVAALMARITETIHVAVQSANYHLHLQNLLEETQRQGEELQSQSEELQSQSEGLRVNNEELEEQSRALKESFFRLEQQQAELEQTNSQLEEQANTLEQQRDDITRAKQAVDKKAQELEQASRYKSDFLSNMSHELRTPLNSSLILAKLLADNSDENLTEEQVNFARTIEASGNDLLNLINDILDLSKIEAGQLDIRPETVALKRVVTDMRRTFEPVAQKKGLTFKTSIDDSLPEFLHTDRQRLEQVLKNLLSNAFKFTEKGHVELKLMPAKDGQMTFSVTDTGIGILPEHQESIFEAFQQADGTINRKFGGTGLGLSISRQLARLLGGQVGLVSSHGKGSTFSITLPFEFSGEVPAFTPAADTTPAPYENTMPATRSEKKTTDSAKNRSNPKGVKDDRDRLDPQKRTILVIEDDESFAKILYDLAHDMDFLCLISHTAEDGLEAAQTHLPQAIVLDVGLPDHSGLSVLDRVKRDPATRHIPVHVVSANDYAHTALSLGAIGYMLKPVKRDELVQAFKDIEGRLTQNVRRVLIVEDDQVQRDSVVRLLKAHDVDTMAVGTAAECLEQLQKHTFDCMVLDLSLPDASGYSLLETLSQQDAYSFPPVIVYTGKDLSHDDEHRLRRYSKSIIIKGAKSPERLLDEVTLFLHQIVSELSPEKQTLLKKARNRDAMLEGRRILIVEDDVRNVYAITNIFEPLGAIVEIARNGVEALDVLDKMEESAKIDLVLMDVMMPEMDGLTATREIRKRPELAKLPVIMLTAKAMKDDQERCLDAGANDYMAKPLDVEKLISLVRVWMPR